MAVQLTLNGMPPLRRSLQQLPGAMRTRVIVPVFEKAIKTVERAIAPLIPVQQRKRRGRYHYRNVLTSVVRQYPAVESVVAMTGAESGKAPQSILVEGGTKPRYTNSKTKYQRLPTGLKTVIKRGQLVTKVVRRKKSIGSFAKNNKRQVLYRGVMPAFKPVERGFDSVESTVRSQIESGIRAGITRELTEAKLSRGG